MKTMLETARINLIKAEQALRDCEELPVREYMIAWRVHKRQIDICSQIIRDIEGEQGLDLV